MTDFYRDFCEPCIVTLILLFQAHILSQLSNNTLRDLALAPELPNFSTELKSGLFETFVSLEKRVKLNFRPKASLKRLQGSRTAR